VLTDAAFEAMEARATEFADGVRSVIAAHELPWSLSQLGARAEYRFTPHPPGNGTQSHAAHDAELDDYLHIALSNRGVLMTPFHNMALMSPATTSEDVATHLRAFEAAVAALTA
jgi:glutamate-1-semialdehyde 2,1-aminomutase